MLFDVDTHTAFLWQNRDETVRICSEQIKEREEVRKNPKTHIWIVFNETLKSLPKFGPWIQWIAMNKAGKSKTGR